MGKNWDKSVCDILPIQIQMHQNNKARDSFRNN